MADFQVPGEVQLHIARQVDHYRDLLSLCLVNRSWYGAAMEALVEKLACRPKSRRTCAIVAWALDKEYFNLLQSIIQKGVRPNFSIQSQLLQHQMKRLQEEAATGTEAHFEWFCKKLAEEDSSFSSFRAAVMRNRGMASRMLDAVRVHARYPPQYREPTRFDYSPLHVAVSYGNTEIVNFLLHARADIKAVGQGMACQCYKHAKVRIFDPHLTPLHVAICFGDIGMAQHLLDRGATNLVSIRKNISAMHNAAWTGSIEMATMLIDGGYQTDIDAKDSYGLSPIVCAIMAGHSSTFGKFLVERGAAFDASVLVAGTPHTILEGLCFYGLFRQAIEYMDACFPYCPLEESLSFGTDVTPEPGHHTFLVLACGGQGLFERKVTAAVTGTNSMPRYDRSGLKTLQHVASCNSAPEIFSLCTQFREPGHGLRLVRYLLDHSADPNVGFEAANGKPCKKSASPLMCAVRKRCIPLAQLLLDHGADINYMSEIGDGFAAAGQTALSRAIQNRAKSTYRYVDAEGAPVKHLATTMVRFLLEHGASVTATRRDRKKGRNVTISALPCAC